MKTRFLSLVGMAIVLAGCGGSALHSTSASTTRSTDVTVGSITLSTGSNAGSDVSDITSRPNPPIQKGTQPKPVAPVPPSTVSQSTTLQPATSSMGSAFDRCGIGSVNGGKRFGGRPRPQLMCAPA
jgi:hypothetical protein